MFNFNCHAHVVLHLRAGIFLAATTTSVFAQPYPWTQPAWELEIDAEKPIIPNCETNRSPEACANVNEARALFNEGARLQARLKEWVEAEVLEIGAWMRQKNYPQAQTWVGRYSSPVPVGTMVFTDTEERLAKMRIEARRAGEEVTDAMIEEVESLSAGYVSTISHIRLSTSEFLDRTDRIDQSATLAHELFHAVHYGANPKAGDEPIWIVEGLATAVEYAWLGTNAQIRDRAPIYDTPLNMPTDPYQRGHFFYELGRALGDDMEYAGEIVQNPSNGDSMAWLDAYLKSVNLELATYYPEFIAEKTDGSMFTSPRSAPEEWRVPVTSSLVYQTGPNTVSPVATGYHPNTVTFSGASGLEEKDRLYFLETGILTAERMGDLSLVVTGDLVGSLDRHSILVLAMDGELVPPLEIKVPNVASTPSASEAQEYDVIFEANNVSFELPDCVLVDEVVEIKWPYPMAKGEISQMRGVSFSATAGGLDQDLIYTAPSSPARAEIHLALPNSLGGTSDVLLGEIEVSSDSAAALDYSSSPLIGDYTMDVGATMIRAQGIIMSVADPFTIPTARIHVVNDALFLEATFQGQYVAFELEGEPCGNEFKGVGAFATGTAEITLAIEEDENGLQTGTGTMVHQADQGQVTWEVTLSPTL